MATRWDFGLRHGRTLDLLRPVVDDAPQLVERIHRELVHAGLSPAHEPKSMGADQVLRWLVIQQVVDLDLDELVGLAELSAWVQRYGRYPGQAWWLDERTLRAHLEPIGDETRDAVHRMWTDAVEQARPRKKKRRRK